jgi:hypothetical protein
MPARIRRLVRLATFVTLMGLTLFPFATSGASARQAAAPQQSTAVAAAAPEVLNLPVPGSNKDGRLEVFSIGSDSSLWHKWQLAPSGSWSGWASFGGTLDQNFAPAVGKNADGRLEVFAVSAGKLWHVWQLAPNGGWSGWASLGGPGAEGYVFSDPAVARNNDGTLSVFVVGSGYEVYRIRQVAPGGAWGFWLDLYRTSDWYPVGSPTVGVNDDGRLEVFVSDQNGRLRHIWQLSSLGLSWSGWYSLGGFVGSLPVVGKNGDGRLEVFAIDLGTEVMAHVWQLASGGAWSGWASLGGAWVGNPAVGRNADGRLEVFAIRASDQSLWHNYQKTAGGSWSGFQYLGGGPWTRSPSVASNLNGRLEVFTASGGRIYHRWQDPTVSGGWGPWALLG